MREMEMMYGAEAIGLKEEIMAHGICYTVILGNKPGERIGLVKQGESGYYPCNGYDYAPDSLEAVRTRIDELNEKMGIPKDVAESASYGSLFGWNIPAAARAHEFWEKKERGK